jgi:peptidylprolyl isomerase
VKTGKLILISFVALAVGSSLAYSQAGAVGSQSPSAQKKTTAKTPAPAPAVPKAAPRDPRQTVVTASGLQYVELVEGSGPTPKDGDTVVVNYTGHFQNGRVFDTSVGKKPYEFVLGRGNVIKGWDEGIASMHVGGKRKLIIPSDLAYGIQGFGKQGDANHIPPNATLVFEVNLLKIK